MRELLDRINQLANKEKVESLSVEKTRTTSPRQNI